MKPRSPLMSSAPISTRVLRLTAAGMAAAGLLAAAASARAEQDPESARAPGRVGAASVHLRDSRIPQAQAQAMAAEVDGLLARLLATPALADPRGFAISRQVILVPPRTGMPDWHPTAAEAMLLARSVAINGGSQADASGAWSGVGEGPTLQLTVNDLGALYVWPEEGEDDRPKFFELTNAPDERDGFPVLHFRSRDHVVISRSGRRPYRHVSQQEVLERGIGDSRKIVDELGDNAAPRLLDTLRGMEAELAALSPARRAEPACQDGSRRGGVLTACTKVGAHFVVAVDPEYFDPARPRTAIQLVTISAPSEGAQGHPTLSPVLRDALRQLDLRAIQAMLD